MTSTGGYHHFEVIKGYSDILECIYCKGLLKDAMELPCGHLICKICLQTFIKASQSECPLSSCKEIFEETQVHDSKYANRLVSNLEVNCLKKEFGCEWTGPIAEYFKIHKKVCNRSEEKKILKDVLEEMKQANLKINKLNEENESNRKEREKLSREIEELKQVNEENLNKIKNLSKDTEELKQMKDENKSMQNTVEELKQEMHDLKKKYGNHQEDKHNITNQPPTPVFQTKEKLLIGGFEKFIENNNCLAIPNISYEEWYEDIFKKLTENTVYLYENYLFGKVRFDGTFETVSWQSKKRDDENKLNIKISHNTVQTFTHNENWDHNHITRSIVLHPKQINKCLELDNTVIQDNYDRFKTNDNVVSEDYYRSREYGSYNSKNYYFLILCCKKK